MLDPALELSANVRTRFFIGGEWDEPMSSKRSAIVHPATEEQLLEVPLADAEDVECAILAARAAFDRGPWPLWSGTERKSVLTNLASSLSRRAPLLARLSTAQVGMPVSLATRLVATGIQRLRYYAELAGAFEFETTRHLTGGTARVRKEPAGVALLTIPWNAPSRSSATSSAPPWRRDAPASSSPRRTARWTPLCWLNAPGRRACRRAC